MLAHASGTPHAFSRAQAESPVILRLRLLEASHAAMGAASDDARRSAHDLIAALRRAIAERPSLTFADVVAKLKTSDDLARGSFSGDAPDRGGIGKKVDGLKKSLLKNALAELARIGPRACTASQRMAL